MSRVCEPVRVGVTGGGGCGCGLGICNPSLTRTRDMGSRISPVSVIESHTVSKPTINDHHDTTRNGTTTIAPHRNPRSTTTHRTTRARLPMNDTNRPPSRDIKTKPPTTTRNEYDHNPSQPTNDLGCPPQ
jgi:hypothetical protein